MLVVLHVTSSGQHYHLVVLVDDEPHGVIERKLPLLFLCVDPAGTLGQHVVAGQGVDPCYLYDVSYHPVSSTPRAMGFPIMSTL